MDPGEYKRLYYGLNRPEDIDRFREEGYDRRLLETLYNQKVNHLATGQYTLMRNCAEILNRGFELDINTDIIRTKDWRWNVGLNFTHYTTILKSRLWGSQTVSATAKDWLNSRLEANMRIINPLHSDSISARAKASSDARCDRRLAGS